MVKEFRGGRGGGDRGRGRGGNRGGRGGYQNFRDQGPPSDVIQVGNVMHPSEEFIVVKNILPEKVPIFNRGVYLENKQKIGIIDDVFGPINDFMFSVKCDTGVKPDSFKENQKVRIII